MPHANLRDGLLHIKGQPTMSGLEFGAGPFEVEMELDHLGGMGVYGALNHSGLDCMVRPAGADPQVLRGFIEGGKGVDGSEIRGGGRGRVTGDAVQQCEIAAARCFDHGNGMSNLCEVRHSGGQDQGEPRARAGDQEIVPEQLVGRDLEEIDERGEDVDGL